MSIISAAEHGYSQQVETLLANGHSVHGKDGSGATALFWAACRGHTRICNILLKANACPDDRVEWGSTALHAAVDGGHTDCVALLINFGGSVNVQNKRGDTPLHLACYHGFTDITSILLKNNAEIFIENNDGKNSYIEADSQKNFKVLDILLRHIRRLNCTATPDSSYQYDQQYLSTLPVCQFATAPMQQDSLTNLSSYSSFSSSSSSSSSSSAPSNKMDSYRSSRFNSISGRVPNECSEISNFCKYNDNSGKNYTRKNIGTKQESNRSFSPCNTIATFDPDLKNIHNIEILKNKLSQEEMEKKDLLRQLNAYEHDISELKEHIRNLSLRFCNEGAVTSSTSLRPDDSFVNNASKPVQNNHSDVSPLSRFVNTDSPQVEATCPTNNNSTGIHDSQLHSPVTHSHKILLQICRQSANLGPDILKQHLLLNWVHYPHKPLIKDSEKTKWLLDVNYTLRDRTPLNGGRPDCLEGTCSLIFRIQYNQHNLILKMLLNILEMNEYGHNQGLSTQNALHHRFGPECLPNSLPLHRNIIQILHNYKGSTLSFKEYQPYFIPSEIENLESAYQTLFLILHEYPTTLKKFIEFSIIDPDQFETFFLQILYQLLNAVSFLQEHHVAHRDIKADNIFLNCFLQPVLADFGFARKLRDDGDVQGRDHVPLYPDSLQDIKCANPFAWAPELTRWNNGFESISLKDATLDEIYRCSDTYAIGRMFYAFFMLDTQTFPSVGSLKPHYTKDEIPALQIPPSLAYILQHLVMDLPSERLTAREAMLRIGCLLYPPSEGDVTRQEEVSFYLKAKRLSLLSVPPPNMPEESMYGKEVCSIAESIQINRDLLEANFLSTVTNEEFWEAYQTMAPFITTTVT
ncbi:Ankyrin repeat domain-containing 1 [Octopus vulgaris]|uniref:Ankyrin repeat domain-containing 1 n=1 Tax=Octopus vulgaris TaxID=6645 RepID=A0AA36FLJ1_OCTVU|nr:Ankyrin repeat domain-containing 1 [Octopus vulgaris]